MKETSKMKTKVTRMVALGLIPAVLAGCQAMQTDTGKGAAVGGGAGALIGGLVDHANPLAGVLIGAAGGALAGGLVGHFMDQRKKDLEQTLQSEINAGDASVTELPGNGLKVSMTRKSAFGPGSAVLNANFLPTLKKIASVVSTYGKMTVAVIGYPDASSSQAQLAYQRAEAVRMQLIGMGVKPILVTASDHPSSPTLDGRVELILTPVQTH